MSTAIPQGRFSPTEALFAPRTPVKNLCANMTVWKALSCVPVIGSVFSNLGQCALQHEVQTTVIPPRLVELISAKNDYKVANIVRAVIMTAIAIAGFVLTTLSGGIFAPILWSIAIGLNVWSISSNIDAISHNQRASQRLQTQGFYHGCTVA